jgi:hypothetical protein
MLKNSQPSIPAKGMAELQLQTGLIDATKIQFTFKASKVTANCRLKGRTYGGRGATLAEAIQDLIDRVSHPYPPVQVH